MITFHPPTDIKKKVSSWSHGMVNTSLRVICLFLTKIQQDSDSRSPAKKSSTHLVVFSFSLSQYMCDYTHTHTHIHIFEGVEWY
jgi:hypothetical protein